MVQEPTGNSASPRIILHVDMDAFFASVEMREHPDLQGKPVIVGADPRGGAGRGVVSTASYEARAFGIHSAMPISKAYERCPDGIYLRPHFDLYTKVSSKVMDIGRIYGDRFEQVSIDEAYLDLSSADSYPVAQEKALAMKRAIKNATGLTCSIGIGPSKVVAKIASDFRKPDGITVVDEDHVREFLSPLPVEKIPGVGKKTRDAFHRIGITTIGELSKVDVQELIAIFGKWGVVLHDLAFGLDDREVEEDDGYKSISREITFDEDTDNPELLRRMLDEMADELHLIILGEGLRFKTVTIKVRDEHFQTFTRSKTLDRYMDDISSLKEPAYLLFSRSVRGKKIRLVGLKVSGFEPRGTRQTTIGEFMPR
jgi:DNA polymerase IV (archaeal DinB-like DNA polymerase)